MSQTPKKKVVVVKTHENGKIILVGYVTEVDPKDLYDLQKMAKKNLESIFQSYETRITELQEQVEKLTKDVKYLKGE